VTRDGDFELVTLRNGARAVRSLSLGEVMHPSVGPWREAQLLYVEQLGLAAALSRPGPPLCVYDVGLGAATNAVAALECARSLGAARQRELKVLSFERDLAPLRLALADPEGFPFLTPWAAAAAQLMGQGLSGGEGLAWRLYEGDALARLEEPAEQADLVYFDPFSPASNPAFWTLEAFARVRARCSPGALLATYSAATPTRVSMLLGGFFVGAGAAVGTKQETTVAAVEKEALQRPLDARWLDRWRRSSARAPHGAQLTAEHERAVLEHPQFR
jgi:hypothetical protein